jgi:hypothetical protein
MATYEPTGSAQLQLDNFCLEIACLIRALEAQRYPRGQQLLFKLDALLRACPQLFYYEHRTTHRNILGTVRRHPRPAWLSAACPVPPPGTHTHRLTAMIRRSPPGVARGCWSPIPPPQILSLVPHATPSGPPVPIRRRRGRAR